MKQAKVLNDAELKRVLAVIDMGRHARRNRMAVLLSHYAGLRVGEIAVLTWRYLLDSSGKVREQFWLAAIQTKTNETRAVYLNRRLQKEIAEYRDNVQSRSLDFAVIASQKGGHFSANSLCQLFARIYANAGVDGASSHSGRRWFITRLAHSGISPKVIMTLAGHRSLSTTQRYIDVNEEMLSAAVSQLPNERTKGR